MCCDPLRFILGFIDLWRYYLSSSRNCVKKPSRKGKAWSPSFAFGEWGPPFSLLLVFFRQLRTQVRGSASHALGLGPLAFLAPSHFLGHRLTPRKTRRFCFALQGSAQSPLSSPMGLGRRTDQVPRALKGKKIRAGYRRRSKED